MKIIRAASNSLAGEEWVFCQLALHFHCTLKIVFLVFSNFFFFLFLKELVYPPFHSFQEFFYLSKLLSFYPFKFHCLSWCCSVIMHSLPYSETYVNEKANTGVPFDLSLLFHFLAIRKWRNILPPMRNREELKYFLSPFHRQLPKPGNIYPLFPYISLLVVSYYNYNCDSVSYWVTSIRFSELLLSYNYS